MLSIGEFSKICGVSTKTLRYYDEIGLIRPDETNPHNGYRYYSIGQLKKLLYINRLKKYSFSLDEIKSLLEWNEDQSEEKLHCALIRKKKHIEQQLAALEATLHQMNSDIRNMEEGFSLMSYLDQIEVELVEASSRNILYTRQMMSSSDYAAGYGMYFQMLYEKIATEQLTILGTPMAIYHSPEYNPAGNDTEFAIPIQEAVRGTRVFAGGLCAKSVLKGNYAELTSVYATLREWIEQEGYELMNYPYEVYVTDPHQTSTPAVMITEVYFPVRKISTASSV
ncbi:MerR family transcriptional regulator [Paenibacillus sp. 1001270B_150601_E10]|uniref:MerR family transcriptional regulator n=1 Tax=Paenibacillus sp. 1001270B_150601_E10 TaxID=2787079 RepID=UPI00189FF5EF|nr:MerR family transcriptional regulator [Paenibacillus sp. 1001270B_150601_E10]